MDDLISRSVLKAAFSKNSIFEKITDARGMNVLEIIDEQPIAYDVEKVVEELEGKTGYMVVFTNIVNEIEYSGVCIPKNEAIEIVKAGGVE